MSGTSNKLDIEALTETSKYYAIMLNILQALLITQKNMGWYLGNCELKEKTYKNDINEYRWGKQLM